MSNQYYLMAQLPAFSVSSGSSLPFSEEYFIELCSRFLDAKSIALLKTISLEPPKNPVKTGSVFVDSWYAWERDLRLVLAQIRSVKLKKEFSGTLFISPAIIQVARTAAGFDNPLEAEEYINNERLAAINRLTPLDAFSLDSLYAYGLKLKLALRIKKFNREAGMASYLRIYDTILGEST